MIGTLLGDGHLEKNGRYVRLKIDHSSRQKDFVWWKYQIFSNYTIQVPKLCQVFDYRTNKRYEHSRFSTVSSKDFCKYHKLFYPNGRKKLPATIVNLLKSPLSLAIWYMDDGARRTDCKALRLHTNSFDLSDQKILQQILKSNYCVESTIQKSGNSYVLYIPANQAMKFCNLVRPFILPEFSGKLL